MQSWRTELAGAGNGGAVGGASMTFDEASMERSKSFIKALQELKNLRPQLYSAAEYCEKSYLNSEQKQMVLDNLKDYAVRALINAVDHLGTVAYKLTDLFDQQSSDVSVLEFKASCLSQQIIACQTYTDNESMRQQQMFGTVPKLHKRYILPSTGNRRMPNMAQVESDSPLEKKPRPYPSAKTLSWHLASDNPASPNGRPLPVAAENNRLVDKQPLRITADAFNLTGKEPVAAALPRHLQIAPKISSPDRSKDVPYIRHDASNRLIDTRGRQQQQQIVRRPAHSKNVLSAFFAKPKTGKLKKISVP